MKTISVQIPELDERQIAIYDMMCKLKKEHRLTTVAVMRLFINYRPSLLEELPEKYNKANKYKEGFTYHSWTLQVEGLKEQLDSFSRYNSWNQEHVIEAFNVGVYAFQTDFEIGDLVYHEKTGTVGYVNQIGVYAGTPTITLYSRKESQGYWSGDFPLEELVKVAVVRKR